MQPRLGRTLAGILTYLIRSRVSDTIELRVNWSEGFALPNGWIKYQAESINLDPVVFRQSELGMSWTPDTSFDFDIAVYESKSNGEIRTVAPGVFENYGATERSGIETTLNWRPRKSVSLLAIYGFTDSEVLRNGDPALVGNQIGGVPEYSGTIRAQWNPDTHWQATLNWRLVGSWAITTQNTLYSDSYNYLDMGVSYTWDSERSWKLYGKLENLTDKHYAPYHATMSGLEMFSSGTPRQFRIGLHASF